MEQIIIFILLLHSIQKIFSINLENLTRFQAHYRILSILNFNYFKNKSLKYIYR